MSLILFKIDHLVCLVFIFINLNYSVLLAQDSTKFEFVHNTKGINKQFKPNSRLYVRYKEDTLIKRLNFRDYYLMEGQLYVDNLNINLASIQSVRGQLERSDGAWIAGTLLQVIGGGLFCVGVFTSAYVVGDHSPEYLPLALLLYNVPGTLIIYLGRRIKGKRRFNLQKNWRISTIQGA